MKERRVVITLDSSFLASEFTIMRRRSCFPLPKRNLVHDSQHEVRSILVINIVRLDEDILIVFLSLNYNNRIITNLPEIYTTPRYGPSYQLCFIYSYVLSQDPLQKWTSSYTN